MVKGGGNVLLLAPSLEEADDDACLDLLTVAPIERENVLSVVLATSPGERLALWERRIDEYPAAVTFVSADDRPRATTTSRADASDVTRRTGSDVSVTSVSSPGNVTELGVRITEQLDAWEAGDGESQIVICVHSLTAILQYVTLEGAFKFLHVLTGRISSAGAIAHYHMDPTAHERDDVRTLLGLFDVVCEYEDGAWTVRTR